jgi:hypothetical protein
MIVGSDRESAEEVSCAETDATVDGAPIHECTIAYCDYVDPFGLCREAKTSACAALVDGQPVLISKNVTVGPVELRDELTRSARC